MRFCAGTGDVLPSHKAGACWESSEAGLRMAAVQWCRGGAAGRLSFFTLSLSVSLMAEGDAGDAGETAGCGGRGGSGGGYTAQVWGDERSWAGAGTAGPFVDDRALSRPQLSAKLKGDGASQ
ncbi:hypothetical protein J1614_000328 [Plenodomus biglobosus]|nr:hypothetical protein J1614_000328 [Plenodomus biglobosus]